MRRPTTLLGAISFAALIAGSVTAQADPKERCYQLCDYGGIGQCYVDLARLVFGDPLRSHTPLYGSWFAPSLYSIPVSGAYENDSNTGKRIGVTGAYRTNGGTTANLAMLDGFIGGPWTVQYIYAADNILVVSGDTLQVTSCHGLANHLSNAGATANVRKR